MRPTATAAARSRRSPCPTPRPAPCACASPPASATATPAPRAARSTRPSARSGCRPAAEPPAPRLSARRASGPSALAGLLLGRPELLLDDAALVVADLQALLEVRDRVGGLAGQAQRPPEVVERVGVVDVALVAVLAEAVDGGLQQRDRGLRIARQLRVALVVERARRLAGGGGRRRGGRRLRGRRGRGRLRGGRRRRRGGRAGGGG